MKKMVLFLLLLPIVFGYSSQSGWPISVGNNVRILSSPVLQNNIIVGSSDGNVHIFLINGAELSNWPIKSAGIETTSPAVADLDGDGNLEIIAASSSESHRTAAAGFINVWSVNGSTFWGYTFSNEIRSSPSLADLNADGRLEVIIGSTKESKLYVFLNNGTIYWTANLEGEIFSSPAIADLDRDGKPEVVAASKGGKIYAWHGDGTVFWNVYVGSVGSSSPVIGDINFDGNLEVIIASDNGLYAISNGNILWQNNNIKSGATPALGDINKDGNLEIVLGTNALGPNNKIYAISSNGSIIWSKQLSYTLPEYREKVASSPAISDIDGDGNVDILVATASTNSQAGSGKFYVFEYTGAEKWSVSIDNMFFESIGSSPAIADLDGDGNLEIVLGSADGKLHVFDAGAKKGNYLPWTMFQHDAKHTGLYDLPLLKFISPADGSTFSQSDAISFSGQGLGLDGSAPAYTWTSDKDGLLSSSSSFTKVGLSSGTHVITLTATDGEGKSTSFSRKIQVNNVPPAAAIISPSNGSEFTKGYGETITVSFSASGSDVYGSITKYEWDFDGDGTYDWSSGTSGNVAYTYSAPGIYTAKFRVTDNDGATASAQVTIKIKSRPLALIHSPKEGAFKSKDAVLFNGTGYDEDSAALSYIWTSDKDGILSTKSSFSSSGLSLGIHTITFTVTDSDGLADSDSVNISIDAPLERIKKRLLFNGRILEITPDNALSLIEQFANKKFYIGEKKLAGVLGALESFLISPTLAKDANDIVEVGVLPGDVYAVASELVLENYTKSKRAIIARGDLEVDSIASVAYAKALNIPILLVKPNEIPSVTDIALKKLGVDSIIVLGGNVAVSDKVLEKLPAAAARIAGKDRFETAVKIAEALAAQTKVDTVVITDGTSPDLLAVLAAVSYNAPILYVKGSEVPEVTMKFLQTNKFNVVLVGVSQDAAVKIKAVVS